MSVLVSIIVPSLNSSRFIQHSIKSVVDQTYENWELLIVDGGPQTELSNWSSDCA